MRLGVWGWWQGKNLGDNWILSTMKKMFGNDIIPLNTEMNDFRGLDFVICGGGGLFVNDIPYPWNKDISVPHGFFGIGTEHGANNEAISRVVRSSEFFYVRDRMTMNKLGLTDNKHLISDVTFFDPIKLKEIKNSQNSKILLSWRSDLDDVLYSKEHWKKYIGKHSTKKEWISKLSLFGGVKEEPFDTTDNDIERVMEDVRFVVSQRYHGIVAAIQSGIPCIALDVCPKNRAIMENCGLEDFCVKIGEIDKLNDLYGRCITEENEIKRKMKRYCEDSKKRIDEALSFAKKSIDGAK